MNRLTDGFNIATDQDGDSVVVELDEAGRTWRVTRGVGESPNTRTITVEYTYDAASRVTRIDQGNSNWIERENDDANRLFRFINKHASGRTMLQQIFSWTNDGLIAEITETDNATVLNETITATVTFEYDNRNRLIRETREDSGATGVAPVEYDIEYTYDQGGNRLSKVDHLLDYATAYVYDVHEDPEDVGDQHNNRLLSQATTDEFEFEVERRWYTYGKDGNLFRLIVESEGYAWKDVYWFYYDSAGRLWLCVRGLAEYDDETDTLSNEQIWSAAEYRYDGGRQRYMVRLRDPNDDFAIIDSGEWRDYMGNDIHRDYTVDPAVGGGSGGVTNGTSYLAGIGYDDDSANGPNYISGDQIGTTRRIADSTGCEDVPPACLPAILHRKISTAFGEPMSTVNASGFDAPRYGYAGAWGYQEPRSGDPLQALGWLHVGERYYAPELGRFVQRDPIGIRGGTNVYLYALVLPSQLSDPTGLYWDFDDVTNPDGTITRHFYDRGWTGWFRNEYKYSVRVPGGMPPPLPPRTIDQRVIAVCIATEVGIIGGGIRGAWTGGPQGMVFGGLGGGVMGLIGGIVREACY